MGTICWAINEHKSAGILQALLHRLSENTKQQLHLVNKNYTIFLFVKLVFFYEVVREPIVSGHLTSLFQC